VEGVLPISRIYIAGITSPAHRSEADRSVLGAAFGVRPAMMEGLRERLHEFEPPRSEPSRLRPLHPDLAAAVGAVFLLVLIVNAYAANRQLWAAPLWLGAGLGLVYLLGRMRLMASYRSALETRRRDRQSLANAMARWRRVYFCPRDALLFEMDGQAARPLPSQRVKHPIEKPTRLLDWVRGRR
jgi:hypothetical protein